jgi:hypothetical protein
MQDKQTIYSKATDLYKKSGEALKHTHTHTHTHTHKTNYYEAKSSLDSSAY